MSALPIVFGVLLFSTALFLILLVLVQRGRGGGLSGALGGMGGQSAFGTKAGDLFTRITMFAAAFWIVLCITTILVLNRQTSGDVPGGGEGTEYTTVGSESGESEDGEGAGAGPAEEESSDGAGE